MQSSDRTIALILIGVLAVMLWPVWLAAAAAERQFTWTVAATALLPLAFSLLVIAAALRLPSRLAHSYQHGVHTLGERLHAGTHRHA
ncbi:MAG: hypothetical protein ACHP7E_07765 [Burkholderiales bacterium]|jgi:hypothetical protein